MKKSLPFILLFVILFMTNSQVFSQKYATKIGEISVQELEANTFARDTAAGAVMISEYAYRTISPAEYRPWERAKLPVIPARGYAQNRYYDLFPYAVETLVQCKIKILKPSGLKKSEITIPFINKRVPLRKELIENIDAWSYKYDGSQIVTSRLKKENVVIEHLNDSMSQVKFRIPDVKVGSVVEYRYKRISPLHPGIPGWEFQSDIPTMYSALETFYYDAFVVNQETKGPYEIKAFAETEQPTFTDVRQTVFTGRKAHRVFFEVRDLPAFRHEDYIWNPKDYTPGVRSELLATRFVGYVPYADKWLDVENRIIVENLFEKNIYGTVFYGKEIKTLVKPLKTDKEKIEAIYRLVKDKIKWNGKYALYGDPTEAVSKGFGSNAEINAVLLRALYKQRLYVYPVLISPRTDGRLPVSFPTYNGIKTFIVCVETKDGDKYYLDGSAMYGGLNMLPSDLMVDNGRTLARSFMLEEGQGNGNVNLTTINNADFTEKVKAKLLENGMLEGNFEGVYSNLGAYYVKKSFAATGDSLTFVKIIEDRNDITVKNYSLMNHRDPMSEQILEKITFEKKANKSHENYVINPFVLGQNLLNLQIENDRTLPVELDFPRKYNLTFEMEIPDGYQVVRLPENKTAEGVEGNLKMEFTADQNGNSVFVRLMLDVNKVVFAPAELDEFRNIFSLIEKVYQDSIVVRPTSTN